MKKIIASVLCFTMCAAMFAGCSSDGSTTTAGTTAGNGGGGDETTTETTTMTVGTGSISLKVYAMSNEVPGMIEEYFKRNPDVGAKYTVDATVSNNDDHAYETKLNAALRLRTFTLLRLTTFCLTHRVSSLALLLLIPVSSTTLTERSVTLRSLATQSILVLTQTVIWLLSATSAQVVL